MGSTLRASRWIRSFLGEWPLRAERCSSHRTCSARCSKASTPWSSSPTAAWCIRADCSSSKPAHACWWMRRTAPRLSAALLAAGITSQRGHGGLAGRRALRRRDWGGRAPRRRAAQPAQRRARRAGERLPRPRRGREHAVSFMSAVRAELDEAHQHPAVVGATPGAGWVCRVCGRHPRRGVRRAGGEAGDLRRQCSAPSGCRPAPGYLQRHLIDRYVSPCCSGRSLPPRSFGIRR